MKLFSGKLASGIELFGSFLLLNLMWLLFSLPVITLFPSTSAMFEVIKKWKAEGVDSWVFQPFFQAFKKHFKLSVTLEIIWLAILASLSVDLYFLGHVHFPGRGFLLVILFMFFLVYGLMSVHLFSLIVRATLTLGSLLKNALLLALGKLFTSLTTLIVVLAMVALALHFPIAILMLGSLTAFLLYSVSLKVLHSIS